jgi:wyosine [tRNA(Phe)-imidazoG37] synthetase (radical SAM superfamily)
MDKNNDARATPHVFGPVPSRRLGRSLGVDLTPRKVCSFNCTYCQVGRTTRLTTARETFMAASEIVAEVREKLAAGPRPDYITLSGSGEPTLHAGIGEIIEGIQRLTDVPVAVMTNGSLFWNADVRRACLRADLILPTLAAGDEETFRAINRPAAGLTLERVVAGLIALRRDYAGPIWLEVFLVEGVNSSPEQVRKIAAQAAKIQPDKIQLNTAVRPTAEPGVKALGEAALSELCRLLGPKAEVIADFRRRPDASASDVPEGAAAVSRPARAEELSAESPRRGTRTEVLETIRRRPVTVQDIAAGLGIPPPDAAERVEELLAANLITRERRGNRDFYRATGG